jgi:hypothetical protein
MRNLKNACPLLELPYPIIKHSQYGYFAFASDQDKGLIQALKDIFQLTIQPNAVFIRRAQCHSKIQQIFGP